MRHTKNKGLVFALFVAMALAVSGARADTYALDRFKGGGADGYATVGLIRDISVTASYIRFSGGTADGYDLLSLSGLRMPQPGLLIRVY